MQKEKRKTNQTVSSEPLSPELTEALEILEQLFSEYAHSVPSANQKYCTSRYFAALPYGQLSADDLAFGKPRYEARQELLEHFEQMRSEGGPLHTWPSAWEGKYFWQSANQPQLIIRRDWIEQANK